MRTNGERDDGELTVAGWVHETSPDGLVVRDREGYVRVEFGAADGVEPPPESVVEVTGHVRDGGSDPTVLEASDVHVLDEPGTEPPIRPADAGTHDRATRLDHRHLDLRREEVRAVFEVREAVVEALRRAFRDLGAMEVDLPVLVPTVTEGKKDLFEVSYFDRTLLLTGHHSNQYKQLLMSGGLERIYCIGKIFGYEDGGAVNSRCVSEATAVQFDCAFVEYEGFMDLVEEVVVSVHEHLLEHCQPQLDALGVDLSMPDEFERLSYETCLELANETLGPDDRLEWGDDLPIEAEQAIGDRIGNYYFITDWPAEVRDFYVQRQEGTELAKAFDLMHPRMELMSGSQREHRADEIARAVEAEPRLDPSKLAFYTEAFEHGMPPHSGGGMGLGRFLMTLLDLEDIREAVLFPRDLHRTKP